MKAVVEGRATTPMRIGYVTAGDPRDKRFWSGTPHYMARSLEDYVGEVSYLGPIEPNGFLWRKVVGKLSPAVTGRRYLHKHSLGLADAYRRELEKKLANTSFDVLIAAAGSTLICDLETDIPIVQSSDTTFCLVRDYYPEFSNAWAGSLRQAEEIELRAIERADLLIYSAPWAAESAIRDYGAAPEKVHVVPYGANLEADPPIARLQERSTRDPGMKLLFVGRDWERKGGAIVLAAFEDLVRRGLEPQLTIVGCVPPNPIVDNRVTVIPSLNKNDPEQRARFEELYWNSDLFVLPTRQECYGIVFCEANAYGLPVVVSDTGGVSGIVETGINGVLLQEDADPAEYADSIQELLTDPQRYHEMSLTCRRLYEERYSWRAFGQTTKRLVDELLESRR